MEVVPIENTENFIRPEKNDYLPRQEIESMFNKKFQYQRGKDELDWKLPNPNELFKEFYQIDTIQQLRDRLNDVKSKLNNYVIEDWSAHTRKKDPAGGIPWNLKQETKAEFVTVAWCKFFECLHQFPLVTSSKLNSLHLCEAPGAFIAALNHYLHSTFEADEIKWNWLSTTLNPYYEGNPLNKMIADDRFMLYTLENWIFHADFTGNILKRENIEHMEKQCKERLNGEVHLITADGSIDCVEKPDCQEEMVAQLHFTEIVVALSILSNGGAFIIKMFTLFESTSVCEMFLLHCVFEQVHVFKPASSKRGNSEVYIICLNYRKNTKYLTETLEVMKTKVEEEGLLLPLFAKSHLPANFLLQHEICSRYFMHLQIRAIEMNIYSFETKLRHNTRKNHELRTLVSQEYYRRYKVKPIPEQLKILYARQGKIDVGKKTFLYRGSFSEREMLKDTGVEEQLFKLRGTLNDMERALENRYDILLNTENTVENTLVDNLPLKLYEGEPFIKLHSSLFADVQVLQFAQNLQKLYGSDPLYQYRAKCQLNNKEIVITDSKNEINFFELQRQFLIQVLANIIENEPKEVCFFEFPFLTHFSVSILRFLSVKIFHSLLITTSPSFIVKLSKPHFDEQSIHQLKSMYSVIQNNSRLLCVLNIAQLHRNEFSNALSEFNNALLIQLFKDILHF